MNIHGLKQKLSNARSWIRKEKEKPRNKQDEFAIRKLESGMKITRSKIKDLRMKK